MQRCPDLEAVAHLVNEVAPGCQQTRQSCPEFEADHLPAASTLRIQPFQIAGRRCRCVGRAGDVCVASSCLPRCQLHRLPPTCAFLHPSVCARGAGECFCGCSR